MRILFYVINGIGLGHLNKMILVANEIRRLRPQWELLFVTNAKVTDMLDKENLQFIRLPLSEKDLILKPIQGLADEDYIKLIMSVVESYAPNLILYDWSFPAAIAKYVKLLGIKNAVILRKDKNTKLNSLLSNPDLISFDYICACYSKQEMRELNIGKKLWELIRKRKVELIGQLVKQGVRREHEKGKFRVLVTAGGGGWHDTDEFLRKALASCEELVINNQGVSCKIVTGPLYEGSLSTSFPNITITRFDPDLFSELCSSDLVISQAGYNICNEIIVARTPAILFPGYRFSEDTKERAKRLEKKGSAIVVNSPRRISSVLNRLYKNKKLLSRMRSNFSKLHIKVGTGLLARRIIGLCEDTLVVERFSPASAKLLKKRRYKSVVLKSTAITRPLLGFINLANERQKSVVQLYSNDQNLANPDFVEQLMGAGVNSFMIDIYGHSPAMHDKIAGKGNFRKMMRLISILAESKTHFVANCVIDEQNCVYLSKTVALLFRAGAFHVQIAMSEDSLKSEKLTGQMIKLRKIKLKPQNYFRIMNFSQQAASPDAINAVRYYQAMISSHARANKVISNNKEQLLQKHKLLDKFADIDNRTAYLGRRLVSEYAEGTDIENAIARLSSKKLGILKATSTGSTDLIALESKLEELAAKKRAVLSQYDELEISRTHSSGRQKPRSEKLDRALRVIDDARAALMAKKHRLLGRVNAVQELKKTDKLLQKLSSALNRHFSRRINPLKEEISELLYQKEVLLNKAGIFDEFALLNRKQEFHEKEIGLISRVMSGFKQRGGAK